MKDGLYIVNRQNIYAAFVVHGGEITQCAPILKNNLDYWKKVAEWVPTRDDSPVTEEEEEEDYPPAVRTGAE